MGRPDGLTPAQAWWLATRGAARALALEGVIGGLEAGHEADVLVLDPAATPLLAYRSAQCEDIGELLAVLMMLGDDRAVAATWIGGKLAYQRGEKAPAEAVRALR